MHILEQTRSWRRKREIVIDFRWSCRPTGLVLPFWPCQPLCLLQMYLLQALVCCCFRSTFSRAFAVEESICRVLSRSVINIHSVFKIGICEKYNRCRFHWLSKFWTTRYSSCCHSGYDHPSKFGSISLSVRRSKCENRCERRVCI